MRSRILSISTSAARFPKVVGKNGGSSLLKDLPLLASVAGGVVKAVGERIPVTAKIRIGWDFQSLCAMDACRLLENEEFP